MTTGTVTLKATFPNTDQALWPGAFVDVILELDTEPGAIVVPASAVTVGQRGPQVFVVKGDDTVDLRTVTTGRTVGRETIIKTGVEPGERVVTNGQLRLSPGAKVVVKPAADAALAQPEAAFPGAKSSAAVSGHDDHQG